MDKHIHSTIPWYINQTLPETERQSVEAAIQQDQSVIAAVTTWKQVQSALRAQPQQTPSPHVRQELMTRVYDTKRLVTKPNQWLWRSAAYTAMLLAVFMLLWITVQPGVVLEWSGGDGVETFRVYRAKVNQPAYELVGELPAQAGVEQYNFVDTWLLPGQQFTYIIEVQTASGQSALSQVISGNALSALPGQLALLISSGILAGLILKASMQIKPIIFSINGPNLLA